MTTAMERENADLRRRLAAVEYRVAGLRQPVPAAMQSALVATKARADSVAALFGERTPDPVPAETLLAYRRRVLQPFLRHSERFKDTRLDSVDGGTLGLLETEIYRDAIAASKARADSTPGILIPRVSTDAAGRQITKFDGDIMAWLAPFVADGARCRIQRGES